MVKLIDFPEYEWNHVEDELYRNGKCISRGKCNRYTLYNKDGRFFLSAWKVQYAVEHNVSVLKLKDVKVCMKDGKLIDRRDIIRHAAEVRLMGLGERTRHSQMSTLKERIGEMQRLLEALESGNFSFVLRDLQRHRGVLADILIRRFQITSQKSQDEIIDSTIDAILEYIIDKHGVTTSYVSLMEKIGIRVAKAAFLHVRKTVEYKDELKYNG